MNDLDRVMIKQRYLGLKKHYKKLNEIKSSESKNDFSVRSLTVKPKILNSTEKIIEVNRVNKILLTKLQTISSRKPEKLYKPALSDRRTLNLGYRKQIAHKIQEENELIATRIQSQKPQIAKTKFEKDFMLHEKYKNQLSKKRLFKLQEFHWGKLEILVGKKSLTPTILEEDERSFENSLYRSEKISRTPILPSTLTIRHNEFKIKEN